MIRPPPFPTLFPYTTLFRSYTRILTLHGRLTDRVQCLIALNAARSDEHTSELQSQFHLISLLLFSLFFFNDTAPPVPYTLSLHDALPILHAYIDFARSAHRQGAVFDSLERG